MHVQHYLTHVHGDHVAQRPGFVDSDFVIALSAQFCHSSCIYGRIGMWNSKDKFNKM